MQQFSLFAQQQPRWNTAEFSLDRAYRYTLWRGPVGPYVQFIGLNPSTADETNDDPTLRKCQKFARSWGYNAICMTNIFGFRATDPRDMKKVADPVGPDNMAWLKKIAENASLIVAAWSQHGGHLGQDAKVSELLANYTLHAMKLGKSGPYHPLYLPDTTRPFIWRANAT